MFDLRLLLWCLLCGICGTTEKVLFSVHPSFYLQNFDVYGNVSHLVLALLTQYFNLKVLFQAHFGSSSDHNLQRSSYSHNKDFGFFCH